MELRLAVVVLALCGLTAFAPAPFPRKARPKPHSDVSLHALQGLWRVRSLVATRTNGEHRPEPFAFTHIRFKEDRWAFVPDNYSGSTLYVSIDDSKKSAPLTFYALNDPGKKKVYGVGLVRRVGSKLQVLYYWGNENDRPRGFDPPPDAYWLLTLEKE